MSMHTQKTSKASHILAIDFGTAKVGLAMADGETRIAFAYGELENDGQLFEKIGEIIQKEGINLVVIGELSFQGENQKSFEARKIGEKIAKDFQVEVVYQEEMFTTKMASDNLKEAGKKEIKKLDNAEAARLILKSWLESM
jgi:putative Holliday junction resolvase